MNWWIFFAGLGLIRFGLEMFEEAIKKLGGPKLSLILQKYTDKGRKATLVGTIVTGILNSSTLVSLLTLGFVSAGMMKLINAIGLLVGANIGSTATGLIVGYLGFGEFKISMFALPLIAIGGIIMIATSKKPWTYWAKLLIGFGLFFFGIDMLKENVEVMSAIFDFGQYKDMNIWIFGLIGMIVTAMVQSSGAVGVMTLAALHSGIITFEAGFAIILGANIGTTFTALIASLSGSIARRQIGIANVLFNIITVGIGILLFQPYIWFTLDVLGFHDNLAIGNAVINLVFNATTSIAFIPFLGGFAHLIKIIIPERTEVFPLHILKYPLTNENNATQMIDIYLKALHDDKNHIKQLVIQYISEMRTIDMNTTKDYTHIIPHTFNNDNNKKIYEHTKEQIDIILSYMSSLQSHELDTPSRKKLATIVDHYIGMNNALKSTKNIRENIETMRDAIDESLPLVYQALRTLIAKILIAWQDNKKEDILSYIDDMRSYRNNLLTSIQPHIHQGNVGPMDISSLVNVTGELVDVVKSIGRSESV